MRIRPLAGLAVLPVCLGLLAASGCRAVFRAPAVSPDASDPVDGRLMREMNPFVLTRLVSSKLFVEVDWIEGCPPSPRALEALEKTLAEHGDGKQIEVLADDEIPRSAWERVKGRIDLAELVEGHLDHGRREEDPRELIYVLYAPRSDAVYGQEVAGMADSATVQIGDRRVAVPTILLFADRIRQKAQLWITPARVERAVLIHELGHQLGLVSNSEHTQRDHPDHCTEPGCVMNQPQLRSMFYNALPALFAARVPYDFCRRCRRDIETVRRLWKEQAARDPGFVDALRSRRPETASIE